MKHHCWKLILILLCGYINFIFSIEILSIGTAALFGVGSVLYKYTICNFKECCTSKEIPADFNKLEQSLKQKVYGQHLALEVIVSALRAHWNEQEQPSKPLVLSFHGWPGGGKNYIVGFIKDSLYKKGSESSHVHHFMGRIHFPQKEKLEEYKVSLYHSIRDNVSRCPKQLFIFDEVDKVPAGLFNVIKNLIDYNENVDAVDYRRSIFIFLSNIGQSLITNKAIELWKSGIPREEAKLNHFENLITIGAFNEEGGLQHSDTIKSNLIDHYIPFLPMAEEHVRLCILDQFRLRGVNYPDEKYIREVMEFVEWGPLPHNLYSKTGCKRLSQKVAIIVEMNHLRSLRLNG